MSKIYVSIAGGCLTSILSDDPTIEVEIWDWDDLKEDWEIKQLEQEWADLSNTLTDIS